MNFPQIELKLPNWVEQALPEDEYTFVDIKERMQFVINLAKLNIEHASGGPFAAAVFEERSGRLLAPGVNLVMPANCSVAHAEIVALSIAQKIIGNFDLGTDGTARQLVTSTEPCAMCLGAIPWSGIKSLVCGCRDEDARQIGFDEGDKPDNWIKALEDRGIKVVQDILRDEAKAVLFKYRDCDGQIYNSNQE